MANEMDINETAVMQCLTESDLIADYCAQHGPCTLSDLAQYYNSSNNDSVHNDPNLQIVASYVASNNSAGNYVIEDCSYLGNDSDNTGRSVLVRDRNSNDVWVAYNGTDGHEWVDNGDGLCEVSTDSQRAAAGRFDYYVERYGLNASNDIYVTGHSKGGNKAMYTTMMSNHADLITECLNMDGQGFSPEAIEYWNRILGSDEVAARSGKITGLYGKNDYVHELGISIVDPNKVITVDYGGFGLNLAGWHDHQHLFRQGPGGVFTCVLNDECAPGKIESWLNDFMADYMRLDQADRRSSAPAMMALTQLLIGDHSIGSTDGRNVLPDINAILVSLYQTENGKSLIRKLTFILCALFPGLAPAILSMIATLPLQAALNTTDAKPTNDFSNKLILLNKESFEELENSFNSTINEASEAARFAKLAEMHKHDPNMCNAIEKEVLRRTDDIKIIMHMIVEGFVATDQRMRDKAQKIASDYLGPDIANRVYNGETVGVIGNRVIGGNPNVAIFDGDASDPDAIARYFDENISSLL